jgi:acetyltransferase
VIGASDRPGSVGATVWRNVLDGGFKGMVWPVNPRHDQVAGQRAYPSVAALPAVPELAVICIPAAGVPRLIGELGAAGCRAAVVISAGFDSTGADGVSLREAMLAAARPYLIRILGPNCVGLLVPRLGLNASFAPAAALPGRLALVAQSGALVTSVLDWAGERGIGFSHFISLGDGSDVDFGDLLDYLAADVHTDAILLYAESIRQARKFMSAARSAARGKPTLIVKAGRGAAAARAAFSHTGALAGTDLVYDAALRRAGMLRVFTTAELFDAVNMLGHPVRPRGQRLAILTNGGGPGVMALDALGTGTDMAATLTPATLAQLDAVLPATWSRNNPVDIIGDAPVGRYRDALRILLAAPEVDAIVLIHAPTAIVSSAAIAAELLPLLHGCERPVYLCWMGGASVAAARVLCSEAGLAHFDTPEAAVAGHLQLINYQRNQQLLMQVPAAQPDLLPHPDRGAARALIERLGEGPVGEADTKALLALYGIPVAATEVVADAAGALAAARRIGYPLAPSLPRAASAIRWRSNWSRPTSATSPRWAAWHSILTTMPP